MCFIPMVKTKLQRTGVSTAKEIDLTHATKILSILDLKKTLERVSV